MSEYDNEEWNDEEIRARIQAVRQRVAKLCGDKPHQETPAL